MKKYVDRFRVNNLVLLVITLYSVIIIKLLFYGHISQYTIKHVKCEKGELLFTHLPYKIISIQFFYEIGENKQRINNEFLVFIL